VPNFFTILRSILHPYLVYKILTSIQTRIISPTQRLLISVDNEIFWKTAVCPSVNVLGAIIMSTLPEVSKFQCVPINPTDVLTLLQLFRLFIITHIRIIRFLLDGFLYKSSWFFHFCNSANGQEWKLAVEISSQLPWRGRPFCCCCCSWPPTVCTVNSYGRLLSNFHWKMKLWSLFVC